MESFMVFGSLLIIIVFAMNIYVLEHWGFITDPANALLSMYLGAIFAVSLFLLLVLVSIIIARLSEKDKPIRGLFMMAVLSSLAMCIADFVMVSTPGIPPANANGELRTSTGYAVLITSCLSFIFLILSALVPSQYQMISY